MTSERKYPTAISSPSKHGTGFYSSVWPAGNRFVGDPVGLVASKRAEYSIIHSKNKKYPIVFIHARANAIMCEIVDQLEVEGTWFAVATMNEDGNIHITDVVIPVQTGSLSDTDVTPEGESQMMTELLQREDGLEIINNLNCWGHSHHTMSVQPSYTDENQAANHVKERQANEFYVRVIVNKVGDIHVTIYLIKEDLEIWNPRVVVQNINPDTHHEIRHWVAEELGKKHTVVEYVEEDIVNLPGYEVMMDGVVMSEGEV